MRTISFFLVAMLLAGCGYTVLDLPHTEEKPYKKFRVYIDSVDVPFEFKVIGKLSHSIPWQGTHFTREPTRFEKTILLNRLVSDANFFYADGLTRVRFYSRQGDSGYRAFGEAVMIRHIEE